MSIFTDREIEDLRETFKAFDVNEDGQIDIQELGEVMKKMQIHLSYMDLKEMIDSVDDDASGTIDFSEFLVLMQSRVGEGGPDADVRYAFLQFDKNNTGFIDKESIKRTMKEFDHPLTDEEIDAVFKEVDLDEDGRISFREFQQLMRS